MVTVPGRLLIPLVDSLGEGVFDVTVTVTDSAGNSTSESTSGELTIDTTAPAAGSVAPDLATASDTGSSDTDDITADTGSRFTVPAGTGVTGDIVELFADGVSIGTGSVLADGSFSVVTSGLVEGANAVSYRFTDTAGNTGASSPTLSVTLDTVIATPGDCDTDRGR